MGINKNSTFEQPKERVFTNTASVSALIDPKDDPVTDGARKERELVERDLNRARAPDIDLAKRTGRINRGQSAGNEQNFQTQKEKEKYDKAMRTAMKEAQKALEDQLEELNRLISERQARYDELNVQEQALDKYIQDLEDGKTPEMTDKVQQAIKEYEKRTGQKVDPNDLHTMLLILEGVKLDKEQERETIKKLEEKREQTEQEIEAVKRGDPKITQKINNREKTEEGQKANNEVFFGMDDERQQDVAQKIGLSEKEISALGGASADDEAFFGGVTFANNVSETPIKACSLKEIYNEKACGVTLEPKTGVAKDLENRVKSVDTQQPVLNTLPT